MRWKLLLALLALASPVAAQTLPQPTARDTVFKKKFNDEANRRNGPRKSVINALADSLVKPTPAPPPIPAAPVASFTVACDTTFLCKFDGTKSTGYKLSYLWDCGALPNCAPGNTAAFGFKYPHEGDRTTILTVRDSLARTNAKTLTFTVPKPGTPPVDTLPPVDTTTKPPTDTGFVRPTLPRRVPDASPKPCTRQIDVAATADFQQVLNAAQLGDCLNLPPGAEYKGNFHLPTRTCPAGSGWTTIQTKGIADAPGTRITPSGAATFAKITQAFNQFALMADNATCNWQLVHLNIQADPAYTGLIYHLVLLGDGGWVGGGESNISLATQPRNIIVRRSWVHGQPASDLVRCFALNGMDIAVVDNWVDDCHARGFDSQAVEGWNGAGPFLIRNNFLAGAGENIMFGGADPAAPELRPMDITVDGNHIFKDLTWKGVFSVKNGIENKNGRYILYTRNVVKPCTWIQSQVGMCVVLKSATGTSGSTAGPYTGTEDVTFIWNSTDQSHRGMNLQAIDCSGQSCVGVHRVARVWIENNRMTNIGTSNGVPGTGCWQMLYTHGLTNIMTKNNTFVTNQDECGTNVYLAYQGDTLINNIRWVNNMMAGQGYYAIGADCAQPTHQAALDCSIGAGRWVFSGNVVSEVNQEFWSKNPVGNTYKATKAELNLAPNGSAPAFPGVGADIAQLEAKIAGVEATPAQLAERAAMAARAGRPRGAPRYTQKDIDWCKRNACTITHQ